ncbi:MAG: NAD(P)/FAD-dependent oxidoreductase, partial [Desulfobacterales bacterium]
MDPIAPPFHSDIPTKSYDAIVVGGGHNGLVCAAYLAKAGRKVLALENRHILGGAAASDEIFPGFTFSVYSYVVSLFRPHIVRELELTRHGYQVIPLECTFTPFPDGESMTRCGDPEATRREIARFSPADAEMAPRFSLAMTQMARFIKHMIDSPAPDPAALRINELLKLFGLGRRFKSLADGDKYIFTKMMTMSAVEFLRLWFESDRLIGPMSVSGIIGTFLGVRSPGTAYVLLHHYMGEIDGAFRSWGLSKGGTGGVSLACARAARSYGADIRTEAAVEKIILKQGKAVGVVVRGGHEIKGQTVISAADAHQTFFKLVGEQHLDADFVQRLRRFKYRGSSAKVNLAVDRLPDFSSKPGDGPHLRGDITIAPGVEYLEKAYDDAKYGDFSEHPFLDIVIPSLTDPTIAPPGKHVISIFVQYAPYHIKEGAAQWPTKREALGDTVVDTLAEYCPRLKDSILHRQVVTPWDLEQDVGLTEGNIFQGELSLEQLGPFRPVSGWSRYQT